MNILILGAGQVGSSTAVQLANKEDDEVTVVDVDPDKLDKPVSYTHLTLPTNREV